MTLRWDQVENFPLGWSYKILTIKLHTTYPQKHVHPKRKLNMLCLQYIWQCMCIHVEQEILHILIALKLCYSICRDLTLFWAETMTSRFNTFNTFNTLSNIVINEGPFINLAQWSHSSKPKFSLTFDRILACTFNETNCKRVCIRYTSTSPPICHVYIGSTLGVFSWHAWYMFKQSSTTHNWRLKTTQCLAQRAFHHPSTKLKFQSTL